VAGMKLLIGLTADEKSAWPFFKMVNAKNLGNI
jgi:hypothetical protein